VDGTAASREAARQATALAGEEGRLEFVAVTTRAHTTGLAGAGRVAEALGVSATMRTLTATTTADGLIRAAARADLLVIGGKHFGRVQKAVLRRAPCSVLMSRRPPDLPFLNTIIVASDAPSHTRAVAAQLARDRGAQLRIVCGANVVTAATVIGCGLIVVPTGAHTIELTRIAPCSVLAVRPPRRQ
jgi:hypothetical protein